MRAGVGEPAPSVLLIRGPCVCSFRAVNGAAFRLLTSPGCDELDVPDCAGGAEQRGAGSMTAVGRLQGQDWELGC